MDFGLGWLGASYMFVKALHVIATFFWVAGLFMLPRFLVYQCEAQPGSPEDRRWIHRIERLRKIILTPMLLLVWALGLAVAFSYGLKSAGWIHAKILLALILTGYHGWMVGLSKKMAKGERPVAERKLRMWNELPALIAAAMIILAVMKPF